MNWEILFIYFLIEIDVLSTRSGQSVFATSQWKRASDNTWTNQICVIKVKLKLKFVAKVSEPRVDDGDFSFESS